MILVGIPVSPWVRKAILFMKEKHLDFEIIPSHPGGFPGMHPDLLKWSPMGKIPALVDGEHRFSDSSAICFYLDAKFPDNRLIPSTPYELARTVSLTQFANEALGPVLAYRFFFPKMVLPMVLDLEPNLELVADTEKRVLPPLLDRLEADLAGQDWFVGEYGYADICLFGHLSQLLIVEHDISAWPNLMGWFGRMMQRPVVQQMLAEERAFSQQVHRPEFWQQLSTADKERYLIQNIGPSYVEALSHFHARHPDLAP